MIWIRFGLLGLGSGAIYALLALGVNVVYRSSGVINFAGGSVAAVCGFAFYHWRDHNGIPAPLAAVMVLVVGAVIGAASHQLIIERLRSASALIKLVATLGLMTLLQGIATIAWSNTGEQPNPIFPSRVLSITNSLTIDEDRLLMLVSGIVLAAVLWWVYSRTSFGLATSAVSENRRAAATLGWSTTRVELLNWTIGGILCAIAGVLLAPIVSLDANTMALLIIPALAASLIGGFSSFPWTVAGALFIGILQSELSRAEAHAPGISDSAPFLIIVVVIVIGGRARPTRADLPTRLPSIGSGIVKIPWLLIGAGLALLGIVTLSPVWVDAIDVTLVAILVILSIVVVTGLAGQVSLAQWSLAGVGAFVAGRLVAAHGFPFWAGAIVGILATVPAGLVVALPALRTRGVNLAVATIGLGLVIDEMLLGNANLTGGLNGTNVGTPHLFGVDIDDISHPGRWTFVVLVMTVLVGLAVANLRRGRTGLRLLAVRSNERVAASLGIKVYSVKLYAFALSSIIAGLAGVLSGFQEPIIVFSQFDPFSSIVYVEFAFVGGVGWVAGAIYGATLTSGSIVSQAVSSVVDFNKYVLIIGGASVILVLIANPDGIASANAAMVAKVRARIRARRKTPSSPRVHGKPGVVLPRREVTPIRMEIRDLQVKYGGFVALNNVSLTVEPRSVTGLIGPNGAGKTTLLDAVTGFARSASGTVTLDGADITSWSVEKRARRGLARSWQAVELFEELSVRENLLVAIDRHGWVEFARDPFHPGRLPTTQLMETVIEEFGLTDHLDAAPSSLPQGTRRLVGIARAMLAEPSILFLDEPAAGLDQVESEEFGRLVRRIADTYGIAVVLVEHDVPLVMSVCDHIVVLDFGHKIAEGAPTEIRSDPRVVTAYLGEADASAAPAGGAS